MNELVSASPAGGNNYVAVHDPVLPDVTSDGDAAPHQTLPGLLRVLRGRWITVAITAVLCVGAGLLVCFAIRAYSATTIIEVNRDDPADNQGAAPNAAALTSGDLTDEVQTDVSVLQTDDALTLSVVDELQLLKNPSFSKAVAPSEVGKPLSQAPHTRDKVLRLFRGRLKVETPPDTRLITITFKAADPVLASEVTNAFAKAFIDDTLSRRQRSIVSSTSWLQGELADLKRQVQDSQQKLADYERMTGLAGIELTGSANGSGNTSVAVTPENTVTGRLLNLNQELTTAEANRISAEAIYRLVRSHDPDVVLGLGSMAVSTGGGPSAITPDGIAVISALQEQKASFAGQLAAARVKYGENNPRRMEMQQQLDMVATQIQAEMDRIRLRAANNYLYTKLNEDAIRSQFKKQETAADDMADKSVKLQLLAQEAFSNQALYEGLFSKFQSATLALGTGATRIDIVAEAFPAGTLSVPKWGIYLTAITALSLFLGVTTAFICESLDQTIRTPDDLAGLQGVALPGYIPRLKSLRELPPGQSELIEFPSCPFSEAFRALRTEILSAMPPTLPRTMLVTSALRGAGKTTITYNLGVALAQQGVRVLLIDGDLRNPSLHRVFPASLSPGLSEACGNISSPEVPVVVNHASLPSLFLLAAGVQPELPAELFGSSAFEHLLRAMSTEYTYVLIDSPPMLTVTDASVIAGKVDAVVSVARSRKTTRRELVALFKTVRRSRARVLTFVLNDVRYPALDGFYTYNYSRSKENSVAANA
jgi:capsular exopolysaccharide synthesis family protein